MRLKNVFKPPATQLTRWERFTAQGVDFLESNPVVTTMTLFTVYALFGDDVRMLSFHKSADAAFEGLSTLAFFLFLFELTLSCAFKDNYIQWEVLRKVSWRQPLTWHRVASFGSFYFWLDLVATLSLIFEIPWLLELIGLDVGSAGGAGKSARAGRASRAGARAGRIVRIVRMVRLVRLVKLYKYWGSAQKTARDRSGNEDDENADDDDEGIGSLPPESRVGAAMSDITTRRVIVGVLGMLVTLPLLQLDTPDESGFFITGMVKRFATLDANGDGYEASLAELIRKASTVDPNPQRYLVAIDIDDVNVYTARGMHHYENKLRAAEMDSYAEKNPDVLAVYDIREETADAAMFGIGLTLFVIGLLGFGTMTFSADVNRLVIIPIETMVTLVHGISVNPLHYQRVDTGTVAQEGMETAMLLQTIDKIGSLMRVGFGEAGAEIIARNLRDQDDDDQDDQDTDLESTGTGGGRVKPNGPLNLLGSMNLLGTGRRLFAVFGFCDIRKFTDTTECLQEEVMLFVNSIAYLLHNIIAHFGGAANKNVGDAFLITWKVNKKAPDAKKPNKDDVAERALAAFLKFIAELSRQQEFVCAFSVAATAKLYARLPNYQARIGAGLHCGYAIEGAIGSPLKIDATYIGPSINFTEFLESSTKKYGQPLVVSEAFFDMLPPHVRRYMRPVDRVLKKGIMTEAASLYIYDCDLTANYGRGRRGSQASSGIGDEDGSSGSEDDGEGDGDAQASGGEKEKDAPESTSFEKKSFDRSKSTRFEQQGFDHAPANAARRRGSKTLSRSKSTGSGTHRGHRPSGMAHQNSERRQSVTGMPTLEMEPFSSAIWEQDRDLITLRALVEGPFLDIWHEAFRAWLAGEWRTARALFVSCLALTGGNDGPSKYLIKKIDEFGDAPEDWAGFRGAPT